ncbi:MAG: hypothetical protein H6739_33865 [Alphaproteobacteria bacterium]|nr:hypothetical protein [Alphaproteobacteria bacterium]
MRLTPESPESSPDGEESALADAAEQVRAHLVSLRGGAPFLSPFDARLLLGWLEEGVPVAIILRALEDAAEQRRAKRARTPLSLKSARSGVTQAMKRRLSPLEPAGDLKPLVEALARSADPEERGAARALAALTGEGEALLEQALGVSRRFFERAWDRADREALLAEAEVELADLVELMKPAQLARAREEVARDLLRRRHPLLAASRIWDTVMG